MSLTSVVGRMLGDISVLKILRSSGVCTYWSVLAIRMVGNLLHHELGWLGSTVLK